jgi:hypothetical protein
MKITQAGPLDLLGLRSHIAGRAGEIEKIPAND